MLVAVCSFVHFFLSMQIADTLLLVYDVCDQLSPFAELVLNTCLSQGLPSTFHVIQVILYTVYVHGEKGYFIELMIPSQVTQSHKMDLILEN